MNIETNSIFVYPNSVLNTIGMTPSWPRDCQNPSGTPYGVRGYPPTGGHPGGGALSRVGQRYYLDLRRPERDCPTGGCPPGSHHPTPVSSCLATLHGQVWERLTTWQKPWLNYHHPSIIMPISSTGLLVRRTASVLGHGGPAQSALVKSPKLYWRDSRSPGTPCSTWASPAASLAKPLGGSQLGGWVIGADARHLTPMESLTRLFTWREPAISSESISWWSPAAALWAFEVN